MVAWYGKMIQCRSRIVRDCTGMVRSQRTSVPCRNRGRFEQKRRHPQKNGRRRAPKGREEETISRLLRSLTQAPLTYSSTALN